VEEVGRRCLKKANRLVSHERKESERNQKRRRKSDKYTIRSTINELPSTDGHHLPSKMLLPFLIDQLNFQDKRGLTHR
jgi:hypothetical protein